MHCSRYLRVHFARKLDKHLEDWLLPNLTKCNSTDDDNTNLTLSAIQNGYTSKRASTPVLLLSLILLFPGVIPSLRQLDEKLPGYLLLSRWCCHHCLHYKAATLIACMLQSSYDIRTCLQAAKHPTSNASAACSTFDLSLCCLLGSLDCFLRVAALVF